MRESPPLRKGGDNKNFQEGLELGDAHSTNSIILKK